MAGAGPVKQSPRGTPLGEIGDRVIFENDRIRVWIVELDGGGKQPLHQHTLPYLIVSLTEGTNDIVAEDGTVRHTDEKPGEVIWQEAGAVHELRNMTDKLYRNILVELK